MLLAMREDFSIEKDNRRRLLIERMRLTVSFRRVKKTFGFDGGGKIKIMNQR
jgi:hypothetical protein